jgi:flagellar hook-associated protein 3 FlgL
MRINPDSSASLLSMLNRSRQDEQTAIQQLSSGRKAVKPSDDPSAMAAVTQLQRQESQTDEFLHSISSVREFLSTADSTLSSVVQGLDRAVTLGVEGANDTQSPADRQALAQDVRGIRDQLLSLANTSFRGGFIFAGTATQNRPFVADSSTPSGIRYDGNSQVDKIEIGDQRQVTNGVSGDSIFSSPGTDVFDVLNKLATALDNNDVKGIQDATGQVRTAFDHVTASRVVYGNGLAQLDSDEQFLNQSQLQAKTRETELIGADPAVATSQLQQAQFARDATLAAAARTQLMSLLDYLR